MPDASSGTATSTSTETPDPNVVGNLATLLHDVTGASSKSLKVLSELFGAVADVAGVVGGLVGAGATVIGIVNSLFGGPDEVQMALQQILSAIQTAFNNLDIQLGADEILKRNTVLNGYLAPPLADLAGLQTTLNKNPPLSSDELYNQIKECFSALEAINGTAMPDTIWNLDYDWLAFWTDKGVVNSPTWQWHEIPTQPGPGFWGESPMDIGYGPQTPPKNSDNNTVFNYNYSLIAYVIAASTFLTVGVALDPNFKANYAGQLSTILSTLQDRHDLIYNTGFVNLQPQSWAQAGLLSMGYSGTQGFIGPNSPPTSTSADGKVTSLPDGATLYFAVVERFSGASAMVTNYNVTLNLPGTDPAANTADASYRKMELRILHLRKQLYMYTGLTQVVAMQNRIRTLLGGDQPTTPSLADWSIRRDFIPLMNFPAAVAGGYSLGTLAKHVRNIPPIDGSGSQPISLRTLFAGS